MPSFNNADVIRAAVAKEYGMDVNAPGTHYVDAIVGLHVKGVVTKGEDTEYTPTTSIEYTKVLAIVLDKLGVTRDRVADLVAESIKESLDDKVDYSEYVRNIDLANQRVQDILGKLPKKKRKGRTTFDVTIEEVSYHPNTITA